MKLPVELQDAGRQAWSEIRAHLLEGIVPFWLSHGIDAEHGGYLTCFGPDGSPGTDVDKYIVTQTRMIWGLSALYRLHPDRADLREAAGQGVDFFLQHFWDDVHGGWYWKVRRDGKLIDDGKVVYGQSFAIYALAEYALATGDGRAMEYATRTFDLLMRHCADVRHGGFLENLEADWSVSSPGFAAGDRKSLDIHMHLMEAFTVLAECTGLDVHRRRLKEVIQVILERMVNPVSGCGRNQFDTAFSPIPAINIRRTWNAERFAGEVIEQPMDTTSYGHNLELAWLFNRAGEVLGEPKGTYDSVNRRLVEHALEFGLDAKKGGVYRDGPHHGPPFVRDKEWWQNSEALVGFLDAYETLGDIRYMEAFLKTWDFDKAYFINWDLGEWRQLLDGDGNVLCGDIGNPWKAIYHTGRAMLECMLRLERMLEAPRA